MENDNKLNRKFVVWSVLIGAAFSFLINIISSACYDIFISKSIEFNKLDWHICAFCILFLIALIGYSFFFIYDYPRTPELTLTYLKRFWFYFNNIFLLGRILGFIFAVYILLFSLALLIPIYFLLCKVFGVWWGSVIFIIIFVFVWKKDKYNRKYMKKIFIKNRKNQNISVLIEKSKNQKGLAFVMHGLGGFKEQPHIETFAKAFKNNNYTVIRFDTTNSFGKSDGNYADATITNYYEDLEDVIDWFKEKIFYQEPFVLCGHSLGAICSALYAENYPEKVKALAPISTVISGELSQQTYSKEELEDWQKTGLRTTIGYSSGIKKTIKWAEMEDRLKYNLLLKIDKLIMPTLMLVGELDTSTPLKHQQILFDKLPGEKEMHIIKGAQHTFRDKNHLDEIYNILNQWIKKIN